MMASSVSNFDFMKPRDDSLYRQTGFAQNVMLENTKEERILAAHRASL